jgi:hypothetical protein
MTNAGVDAQILNRTVPEAKEASVPIQDIVNKAGRVVLVANF